MNAEEKRRAPNGRGVGIGLIWLLLLIAVACAIYGYRRVTRSYRVTALLEVRVTPDTPQSIAVAQRACVELLLSAAVIDDTLAATGILQLPTVANQSNPAKWLADRLQVRFVPDAPILEITLRGRDFEGDSWGDDAQVLYKLIPSFQHAIANPPPKIAAELGGIPTVKVIQKPVVIRE